MLTSKLLMRVWVFWTLARHGARKSLYLWLLEIECFDLWRGIDPTSHFIYNYKYFDLWRNVKPLSQLSVWVFWTLAGRKAGKSLYLSSIRNMSAMTAQELSQIRLDLMFQVHEYRTSPVSSFLNINDKINPYFIESFERFSVKIFSQKVSRLPKYPTNWLIKYLAN